MEVDAPPPAAAGGAGADHAGKPTAGSGSHAAPGGTPGAASAPHADSSLHAPAAHHQYAKTPAELLPLFDPPSLDKLKAVGGIEQLAADLRTDLKAGLPTEARASSRHAALDVFGRNDLPEPRMHSLLDFAWDALQDRTLVVLIIAAFVDVAIGIYKAVSGQDRLGWLDGVAIVVAIIIIVGIASGNDYKKQGQFRKLNDFSRNLSVIGVVRHGESIVIPTRELVVGDVCQIETGVILPADGLLIKGYGISCDESSLTGESHACDKDPASEPFLLSGTKVVAGMGTMLVTAVGPNSLNGRSIAALNVEPEDTPLQKQLGKLADQIAKFGLISALGMVIVLVICYFAIKPPEPRSGVRIANDVVNILINGITLVVVAVPEGLPLAVTLSLAHATVRMLKDNNLVRHLQACETMSNATTICSDKTGTLTLNRMSVVQAYLFGKAYDRDQLAHAREQIPEKWLHLVARAVNVNSTATEKPGPNGDIEFVGNKTEVALLTWSGAVGRPYAQDREANRQLGMIPFSSETKRMSVAVQDANEPETPVWLFTKGAAELVVRSCSQYVGPDGEPRSMDADAIARCDAQINAFADESLRNIAVAYRRLAPEDVPQNEGDHLPSALSAQQLVLLGIFAIEDPVRPEVPGAVKTCQNAGIIVRMVTGDNLATAKSISRQCGILDEFGIALEGPVFRELTDEQLDIVLPRLQVLARSSPIDKQILVQKLRRRGETVAVTGDGTNDAPALKAANVGFSMGIAGTEVAKEASDIVLLDDNFSSLVRAVNWGRSVFDAIRKFLQFQLTVNITAVVLTITSSIYSTVSGERRPESVLTAIQLLWVNLLMDSFAALALALDPPTPEMLQRAPSRSNEALVSPVMWKMIIFQAVYQMVVCITLYFTGHHVIDLHGESHGGVDARVATLIFNIFVFCQVFNEINCRSITHDTNVFRGMFKNRIFLGIIIFTTGAQAIIVELGGRVFDTVELGGKGWGISIALGFGSLPLGWLVRQLP
ncbi:hypothetical protein CXG81DRAFT_11701, partial [Caulochytrium protostelioides]